MRKMVKREQTCITVDVKSDGNPVTEIENKAFLSQKSVHELILPDSVRKVGDWAFAHMENLEKVVIPCHAMIWGKQVFLECNRLSEIQIRNDESQNPATPFLMASAVHIMKEEKLLQPERAGNKKEHQKWLEEYDKALLHFLEEPDEEGFDPVFIGWFDVEDMDDQLPRHLKKRREQKAQLVLQRLLYPSYLPEKEKKLLVDYLKDHLPDGEKKREHTVAFSLLCDGEMEYGQDIRYMRILEKENLLSENLILALIDGMENPSPEVTAFLLKKKGEMLQEKNIFEEFIL